MGLNRIKIVLAMPPSQRLNYGALRRLPAIADCFIRKLTTCGNLIGKGGSRRLRKRKGNYRKKLFNVSRQKTVEKMPKCPTRRSLG